MNNHPREDVWGDMVDTDRLGRYYGEWAGKLAKREKGWAVATTGLAMVSLIFGGCRRGSVDCSPDHADRTNQHHAFGLPFRWDCEFGNLPTETTRGPFDRMAEAVAPG